MSWWTLDKTPNDLVLMCQMQSHLWEEAFRTSHQQNLIIQEIFLEEKPEEK